MDALTLLKDVAKRDGVDGLIVEALNDAALLLGKEIEEGERRLRPMLCFAAFRATSGKEPIPMDLAVASELLNNATLLHDDVIDEGEVRRGRPATRVVYGNAISVLSGDYLLVKTIELISKRGPAFMGVFIETLNRIIEGELTQLKCRGTVGTTEEEYFRIIEGKTGSLFRFSALVGGLAANAPKEQCDKLGEYGWHTGIAFQLVDDMLDLTADSARLGKSLLADIKEGKMTLPVILASRMREELKPLLEELSAGGDPGVIAPKVAEITQETGAVAEVRKQAARHTGLAIEAIGGARDLDSRASEVLKELASALLDRES